MVVQLTPDRVTVVRDALDQPFRRMESEAQWLGIAQMLDAIIHNNSDMPGHIRRLWQLAGEQSSLRANAGQPFNRDMTGHHLAATIESGLSLLRFLAEWVERVQAHGQAVPTAHALKAMIADVDAVRSEALDNWPWTPTKEEWNEAVAEFERGESEGVDDAFAAASGLSREEWGRLVEERRRAPAGGADR